MANNVQRGDFVAVGERMAVEVVEAAQAAPRGNHRDDELAADTARRTGQQ